MRTSDKTTHRIEVDEDGERGYRIATRQEAAGRDVLNHWCSATAEIETNDAAMLYAMLKVLGEAVKNGVATHTITAKVEFEELTEDDAKRIEAIRDIGTGWDVRISEPHVDIVYYGPLLNREEAA